MVTAVGDHEAAFTAPGFRALARTCLLADPTDAIFDPRSGRVRVRSDWDLDPELKADLAVMEPPRPAAVLVPIVARPELTVLLTQRTQGLSRHAGQIAFPGGRIDPCDTSPVEAALRETEEEIALPRTFVEPVGFLDGYRTGTGFHVTPVVALVQPDYVAAPDGIEVADIFEVPLRFLMDAANHHRHTREWRGRHRAYYAMPFGERYIWGATAGMIKNLYDRMFAR